ncbi:MAG TPA: GNAT family N-acetyltransferase [Solirubrobacteraceae bacterium]|nr:GNAT family N-acetyltransferase [Solirubrobacteraceae bacterium]
MLRTASHQPAHDVVLRDGTTVHVRSVDPLDEDALLEFLEALSPDSRAFRFMSLGVNLRAVARRAADTDGAGSVGLVAFGPAGEIVAHAMYVRVDDDSAEVAFAVADDWQGHGLGTVLLGLVAEAASRAGIPRFVALVRADNRRMIEVFRESGFPVSVRARSGTIEVEFPTALGEEALAAFADRDRTAATAAVARFLMPRSVALIGASDRPGSVGAAVLQNLHASFAGPVHLVNRRRRRVGGRRAVRSVAELPADVDLAVVAVPAASVAAVARDCADRGIRALLVLSAGFEDGEAGAELRAELLAICRRSGMRLIGPNCLGLVVTAEAHGLDATFARRSPPAGPVALSTQSGGVAIAAIEAARARGLGFSSVVSIGDRLDLSTNDLLQYWESDGATSVIALYVESFGNPRNFARIARRVARGKPILAVKSGRATAGARAAASHTAAMIAAKDISVDALFRHAGVIRTNTLRELLDTAALLSLQPLPLGPRVGILTNAGGPAIMCADACEAAGLEVPPLGDRTRRRLRRQLRCAAGVANPVDVLGDAPADHFGRALAALGADEDVDAVIAIFVPPFVTPPGDVAAALAKGSAAMPDKPLLAVFLTEEAPPAALSEAQIPCFAFPEDAAHALAHAVGHRRWLSRAAPEPALVVPEPDPDRAASVLADALAEGGGWLSADRLRELAVAYGLPTIEPVQVNSTAEAVRVAAAMPGPVVLKAVAPGLVHKTDAGGVAVGLRGASAIRRAAARMRADLTAAGFHLEGYLVQPMAGQGVEMHVGVTADGLVGPLVACAAGGVTAELLDDVSVRVAPLEGGDPAEMIRELSTFPLLDGYRGAPAADIGALEDVLRRVSALAADHPAIAELDCNPVLVGPDGAAIVDMRVRVAEADERSRLLPGTLPA